MNRSTPWFAGAVCVVAVLLAPSCGGNAENSHEPEEHREETDGHHDEAVVKLSPEQAKAQGITLVTAAPGTLRTHVELPGEVVFDPERVAHVVPRVGGIVIEARKVLGDPVKEGDVLAVLESRELAEAKAAYLASFSRSKLAEANYRREEALWQEQRISSEQEYLNAKQAFEEAEIERKGAEHQLHALGLTHEALARLPEGSDESLSRHEVVAPLDGIIIEKHAARGEALGAETDAFTIADPTRVWVTLNVFPKDLDLVKAGTHVVVTATGDSGRTADSTIEYVAPAVSEETRTAVARVALENADQAWRAGTFVTGRVLADELDAPIVIPAVCVQAMGDETVVFVPGPEGFEARKVLLGRKTGEAVEVVSGLAAGDEVVKDGSFVLKAEIEKAGFEEGHGH